MFESLTDRLSGVFRSLGGRVQLTEEKAQILEDDPRLSYAGRFVSLGDQKLNDQLSLDLVEYWNGGIATRPTYSRLAEGRLPAQGLYEAAVEIRHRECGEAGIGHLVKGRVKGCGPVPDGGSLASPWTARKQAEALCLSQVGKAEEGFPVLGCLHQDFFRILQERVEFQPET